MIKRLLLTAILLISFGTANAYWQSRSQSSIAAAYVGPGDIVTANGWWGFQAATAAVANANANAADVCDVATGLTCSTIKYLSSGLIDSVTMAAAPACVLSCAVKKLYDNVGAHDLTQAASANWPLVVFGCTGLGTGIPCMSFNGSLHNLVNTSYALTGPNTFVISGITTGNFTTLGIYLGSSGTNQPSIYHNNSANSTQSSCGSGNPTTAATDNTWHGNILVCNTTATLYVDAATGSAASGVGSMSSNFRFGTNGSNFLTGRILAGGVFNSAFSAGNITSVNSNLHTAGGF